MTLFGFGVWCMCVCACEWCGFMVWFVIWVDSKIRRGSERRDNNNAIVTARNAMVIRNAYSQSPSSSGGHCFWRKCFCLCFAAVAAIIYYIVLIVHLPVDCFRAGKCIQFTCVVRSFWSTTETVQHVGPGLLDSLVSPDIELC